MHHRLRFRFCGLLPTKCNSTPKKSWTHLHVLGVHISLTSRVIGVHISLTSHVIGVHISLISRVIGLTDNYTHVSLVVDACEPEGKAAWAKAVTFRLRRFFNEVRLRLKFTHDTVWYVIFMASNQKNIKIYSCILRWYCTIFRIRSFNITHTRSEGNGSTKNSDVSANVRRWRGSDVFGCHCAKMMLKVRTLMSVHLDQRNSHTDPPHSLTHSLTHSFTNLSTDSSG